ncbi:methionine import ATP-binding protein MetN 2 [Lysinibacillus alkalisoli]|uniref:Methionine import ATP-binding protein MetN 2 n=1 Tax=Lysinibacillus alkalisoli TaxID=1911548 RepID=A0A917G5R3_9BACI|nr:methionine ABC transporter ATP-binding protein [Lysinibacillus alkalisoli]GGG24224.1 methionine import ATP-binding protein MetN 2 [Lysinibacillus alkalisoli]
MIALKNIIKKYTTKNGPLTAVDNVNLTINQSEIFGIIGYSGAGKSTLIRLLNGLEQPTEGEVIVNDLKFSHIKGKELREARQKVSMIFQHFNLLWSRTVAENIAFPLEIAGMSKVEREQRVQELITLVGLEGREQAYPSQLSGGQKQRVGIARALANNPQVLLCDEATSALDPETTDNILDLLVDINERLGLTIILITHEMHVIQKICHRVAVMEQGRVVEMGDVLEVFQKPQAPITKRFVSQLTGTEDTNAIFQNVKEHYPTGKLVKLVFVGERTEEPVISQLVKQFDVSVSVVHGNISQTKSGPYGTLVVHIDGASENIKKALQFLHQVDVQTEVISYAN